ncbi:MAG: hypothetical protein NWE88_08095 [Candidatus Bathyarchaeota archaeon]|nr:hypothetical protein [Candidatus Bathyarchaeota archaeon]
MSLIPANIFTGFRNWLSIQSGLAWNQSRVDWTGGIKQFFQRLGEEAGYRVIYTREDQTEYLVDLVWKSETPSRHLALALESELSEVRLNILEDFEKLVDIKSRVKIGIFRLRTDNREELLEEMRILLNSQMLTYPDEIYIVIFLRYNAERARLTFTCYNIDYKGISYEEISNNYSCPFPENTREGL